MRPIRVLSTSVDWLPWSAGVFSRARDEAKPILLSIVASWCPWCREMDATTYADPTTATLINERFVPVRVDADERPDISERYTLGGWPTTAFLTPAGSILGGGTYLSSDRMPAALQQVLAALDSRADLRTEPPAPPPSADVRGAGPASREAVIDIVFSAFDPDHGGFGAAPKYPLVAPIQLALDLWDETHDPVYERVAMASLDAMGWGGLYDDVDGGFFHYAGDRGWTSPHTEKLLEPNAALIRLFLDAGSRLGVTRFVERAADALRYVQTWLAEPVDGGWFGSQQADAAYYSATSPDARRLLAPPPVTRRQFADANATMVSAALDAARVFDDEGLRAFALTSLERVLLGGYRPGAGASHYTDGQTRVRGLLADQAAMVEANLDAHEVTGNIVYEMMAEELASYAVRVMWDDEAGGLFDRAADAELDVGLLRSRLKPFAINCEFARSLVRLAGTSGESEWLDRARQIVRAMAPFAAEQGPLAAHWIRASRAL